MLNNVSWGEDMKHLLYIIITIVLGGSCNNIHAYEFDFVNLTNKPIDFIIDLNSGDIANPYYSPIITIKPGDHITQKYSGPQAGFCIENLYSGFGSVLLWSGSVCHNRGFRFDDTGTHEGSDVSLYKFTVGNSTKLPVKADAKLFIVDNSGSGNGGVKELIHNIGAFDRLSSSNKKGSVPFIGDTNVYKIVSLQITDLTTNQVLTFLGGYILTNDMDLKVQVDPISKDLFLVDANNGKAYFSVESILRKGEETMHKAIQAASNVKK